eukprot:GHUV01038570.1.p1 GENE.GHUV01038570.1~~GHUV01038570.1.p1  ORF type:complete len:164 (-),score=25.07 GHUV01038570.1:372-863(-)
MAPGRKPKSKQTDEITSAEAQTGMLDIDHGRQVSEELLLKAQRLHQSCPPNCGSKGSKGSKDNPQCFCALIPPEGSYRKKGLWQKEIVVGEIGRDPAEDKRKVRPGECCSWWTGTCRQQQIQHSADSALHVTRQATQQSHMYNTVGACRDSLQQQVRLQACCW